MSYVAFTTDYIFRQPVFISANCGARTGHFATANHVTDENSIYDFPILQRGVKLFDTPEAAAAELLPQLLGCDAHAYHIIPADEYNPNVDYFCHPSAVEVTRQHTGNKY